MADAARLEPISADEDRVRAEHERVEVDDEAFLAALDDTVAAMAEFDIPYVLMGGLASASWGRPRWTHDIDLFVRHLDAVSVLRALETKGFETEQTYPDWLFKATREGQLVDVIFKSKGDIYLDEEMVERASVREMRDRQLRFIAAEDLLVIKAVVHDEHMPRHWHDALSLLADCPMDWEYLIRRARKGVRRVLALLLYAQSNDLPVPMWVVRRLYEVVDTEVSPDGAHG